MAQLAHEHTAAERPEESRWAFRRRRTKPRSIPFPELVHMHHLWRDALESSDGRLSEHDRRYRAARTGFEAEHGPVVDEYWCWRIPSAAVLTAKPGGFGRGPRLALHGATDWATEGEPEIAAELHRCGELAARASQVLTGLRQRICMRLVMATASHLLSLVDTRDGAAEASDKRIARALENERKSLAETAAYYHEAATGQAQVVYFTGMAVAVVLIGAFAVLGGLWLRLPNIDDREFYGCLAAGAVGAVVSVIQRINSGRFELEYDVGRLYVRFLGALRPVLGAAFGLALYFAITGQVLKLFELPPKNQATSHFYALLVIAFLAGFSERWAQDTLTSITPSAASGDKGAKGSKPT